MTPDLISSSAAILLSLAFSYIPWLADWYTRQLPNMRRLVMLAALALTSGGALALSCTGVDVWPGLALACNRVGMADLLRSFILALVANQTTFLITPRRA